jgi:hypothetical protein
MKTTSDVAIRCLTFLSRMHTVPMAHSPYYSFNLRDGARSETTRWICAQGVTCSIVERCIAEQPQAMLKATWRHWARIMQRTSWLRSDPVTRVYVREYFNQPAASLTLFVVGASSMNCGGAASSIMKLGTPDDSPMPSKSTSSPSASSSASSSDSSTSSGTS